MSGQPSPTDIPDKAGAPLVSTTKSVALGALIALCCWISITYTREPGGTSALWIAGGILTGVLITSPRSLWAGYVLAAFVGNLSVRAMHGDDWYAVLNLGFASTLEAWIVATLLMRYVGDVTKMANLNRVSRIATASAMAAGAVSALFAALLHVRFGAVSFGSAYATWFISHTLGMLIFATFAVVVRVMDKRLLGRSGQRLQFVLTMAVIGAICLTVFSQTRLPLFFLVYPPLVFGVFRYRFAGVVVGMALLMTSAITATLTGHGPFQITGVGAVGRIQLMQLFIASTCLLVWPVAIVLTERARLARNLRESEQRYRMLADNSRDLVVRIEPSGDRSYISPSVEEMLGWSPREVERGRMDLIHPDDLAQLTSTTKSLFANAGMATVTYRARHKLGHYVWIEAQMRLATNPEKGGQPEIIYTGRDITRRIEIEQALLQNERRLIAITDNLPAFVMHVDTHECYTFANAPTRKTTGIDPAAIIGMTVREFVGPMNYAEIKPRIDAALRGDTVSFEVERDFHGQHYHYQSTYVPDIGLDGRVAGFYVMSSDISQLKRTEQELIVLARYDGLTGLANRFHFNESAEVALARHRRNSQPLALLYLDIDRFKQINDSFGHAVGDEVLREFARRLKDCLRLTDFAARLGGDEFVVLVEDADVAEIPELIARAMIAAMQPAIVVDGRELRATTSIGIAFCQRMPSSKDELLHIADQALYAAKAAGRNVFRTSVAGDPVQLRSNG